MPVDLEYLNKQLATLEHDKRVALELYLRAEGAITIVKHLITEAEKPAQEP